MSGLKKAKNGTLAILTLKATDLKYSMHKKKIDFGSNMVEIPPCYITFHWCAKRKKCHKKKKKERKKEGKKKKKELLNKDWTLVIHEHILLYILVRKYVCMFVCMFVCMCLSIMAIHWDQKGQNFTCAL